MAVAALGLLALLSLLLIGLGRPTALSWYLLGAMQATVVAMFLHLLQAAYLAHDREAIWHLRGAWGEENTRDLLQRAKRKRLIWGWIDGINLQGGDIDHLVVTRRGGLVALDSKWGNRADATDNQNMAQPAARLRFRAEALSRTLRGSQSGARHRARTHPVRVRSAVVIWGSANETVPTGARIHDIDFVSGHGLMAWLSSLSGDPISKPAAHELLAKLADYRATTWPDGNRTPGR